MGETEYTTERIYFVMEGPAFEKNMPIHIVLAGLSELQNIIDRAYLVLSDRERISVRDREVFRLVAREFKRESFWSEIDICCVIGQMLLPFAQQITPKMVWDCTKDAFGFLKLIYSRRKHKEIPQMVKLENGTVNVCYGDQTFNYNAQVIQIGQQSHANYQNLTKLIEKEGVTKITVGTKEVADIRLGSEDKDLFDLPMDIMSEVVKLECDIFDFNKHRNVGKLAVSNGQAVPEGEYLFSVAGDRDYVEFVESMLKSRVMVEAQTEMRQDELGNPVVAHLEVLSVVE